jgi:DNA mismatch endonuclease (patch repair protein)
MDKVSPETRSRMMAGIRGSNTRPERLLRSALFARGFRYRINCRDLSGKPDLKLTRYHAVILVHGCFWHGHDCRYFHVPESNTAFWTAKIAKNRERDMRNVTDLREAGWRVCVVWECLVRSASFKAEPEKIVDALGGWIQGQEPFLELFDADAVAFPGADRSEPGRAGFGRNVDTSRFAAERSPRYGS